MIKMYFDIMREEYRKSQEEGEYISKRQFKTENNIIIIKKVSEQ